MLQGAFRHFSVSDKLSDISLEYDAKFDQCYAIMTGNFFAATKSILHSKVTSIYHQILGKKDTTERLMSTKIYLFIAKLTVVIP